MMVHTARLTGPKIRVHFLVLETGQSRSEVALNVTADAQDPFAVILANWLLDIAGKLQAAQ